MIRRISRYLPVQKASNRNKVSWYLANSPLAALFDDLEQIEGWIESPHSIPPAFLIKALPKKLIFKFPTTEGKFLLCKLHRLSSLKHQLKYRKRAFYETVNQIQASKLGLHTPMIQAYGDCRQFCLPKWNAICMDYVQGCSMRDLFLAGLDENEQWNALLRTLPLFKNLYDTGCNHVDFGPHSILFSQQSGEPDYIIDFEYANFNKPNPKVAAAQAGHFAWSISTNRKWARIELLEEWFDVFLDYLKLEKNSTLAGIFCWHSHHRGSIKQRTFPGENIVGV